MNDIAVINWSCLIQKIFDQFALEARAYANRLLSERFSIQPAVTVEVDGILYELD